jgi:hypothetical protein
MTKITDPKKLILIYGVVISLIAAYYFFYQKFSYHILIVFIACSCDFLFMVLTGDSMGVKYKEKKFFTTMLGGLILIAGITLTVWNYITPLVEISRYTQVAQSVFPFNIILVIVGIALTSWGYFKNIRGEKIST